VVVKHGSALIETARVIGIAEPKSLIVEVVAELVAQRAEKRAVRGHLLSNGRAHPHADLALPRLIVAKEFG